MEGDDRSGVTDRYGAASSTTCPRDTKEIPCWLRVPAATLSISGAHTGSSDTQRTRKLAPEPPALSDSAITNRVAASGPRTVGLHSSPLKNAICGVALHFSSVRRTISTPYSSKFVRLASHRF